MDEFDVLRRIGEDFTPPRDDEAKRRVREKIHALAGYGADGVLPRTGRAVWTAPSRRVVGIAAVLVLIGAFVFYGPLRSAPAAAATLRTLAVTAAEQPTLALPPGSFYYTRSNSTTEITAVALSESRWTALVTATRQLWISPDGSGRLHQMYGPPSFASPEDQQRWEAAGSPQVVPKASDERFGPGELPYLDMSGLPTDDEQLADAIESRTILPGPPGDIESMDIIGDMLRETNASPALRAALFRIASDLDSVELVGDVEDAAGRTGVAIAVEDPRFRRVFVFDPETSSFLEERVTSLPDGGIVEVSTYLESGVVGSTDEGMPRS